MFIRLILVGILALNLGCASRPHPQAERALACNLAMQAYANCIWSGANCKEQDAKAMNACAGLPPSRENQSVEATAWSLDEWHQLLEQEQQRAP